MVLSILSKRLNKILSDQELLEHTNYAYMHEKSIDNCLNQMYDTLEEARNEKLPLIDIMTDQSKAFDLNSSGA